MSIDSKAPFISIPSPRCLLVAMSILMGTVGHSAPVSAPYPPSPVVRAVTWAAPETIVRRAHDSDNWPMTWADDDVLYTAYGDGVGFEPFVEKKLSLGLAKVTGTASDFKGENLRAPSLEQQGNGRMGGKASGLLCVDRVLYLWLRNAGNSQLAWSEDHGTNWHLADWKFTTSFGCPTFLNFGCNYTNARDGFVYIYSPDCDSAYESTNCLVLARVPKARIRERAAYEFFARNEAAEPVWTADIKQRGAVFAAPGLCYRTSASYHAATHRYLLVQPVPTAASLVRGVIDTRAGGGLAIYDAPTPWGPWTTAFFTSQWDVAPGDSASFPTKWMSADGTTLYLVFSADDNFCVRKAQFELAR